MINQKTNSKKSIFFVVLVLLIIVLVMNVITLFARLLSAHSYSTFAYKTSDMMRELERKDYPQLSFMVYDNQKDHKNKSEHTEEFYDFISYFQASILYHAYLDTGDKHNAAKQQSKMDSYYEKFSTHEILQAADGLK